MKMSQQQNIKALLEASSPIFPNHCCGNRPLVFEVGLGKLPFRYTYQPTSPSSGQVQHEETAYRALGQPIPEPVEVVTIVEAIAMNCDIAAPSGDEMHFVANAVEDIRIRALSEEKVSIPLDIVDAEAALAKILQHRKDTAYLRGLVPFCSDPDVEEISQQDEMSAVTLGEVAELLHQRFCRPARSSQMGIGDDRNRHSEYGDLGSLSFLDLCNHGVGHSREGLSVRTVRLGHHDRLTGIPTGHNGRVQGNPS